LFVSQVTGRIHALVQDAVNEQSLFAQLKEKLVTSLKVTAETLLNVISSFPQAPVFGQPISAIDEFIGISLRLQRPKRWMPNSLMCERSSCAIGENLTRSTFLAFL